jgi:hypothetical protein
MYTTKIGWGFTNKKARHCEPNVILNKNTTNYLLTRYYRVRASRLAKTEF